MTGSLDTDKTPADSVAADRAGREDTMNDTLIYDELCEQLGAPERGDPLTYDQVLALAAQTELDLDE